MSGVGSVGSSSAVADLMKLLELKQEKTIDMAKKLIKVAQAGNVAQSSEAGKGELLDILA